jgi:hypothetical protein
MNERNFKVNLSPKAKEAINNLIIKHSIRDSFNVIWRAVRDGSDFLAKNKGNFAYAANVVPIHINRRSEMLTQDKLKIMEFNRLADCRQSAISEFFCNEVIKLGNGFLTAKPPIKN